MAKITVNANAVRKNADAAGQNSELFREKDVFVMNFIGSPGCGKTSILEYTAAHCKKRFAVIVGDVKTSLDADRIMNCDILAYPIETGGGCHLTAEQIGTAVKELDLSAIDILFIENVGNLVCPSAFDLGENIKVGVLSVPEGDEKVRKYPALFSRTDAVFVNKIDLLPYCSFDMEQVEEDCRTARPDVSIYKVSATTGDGFNEWLEFLQKL